MRRAAMPSDLAILSAEQYGGTAFTAKHDKAKELLSVCTDDWPRKRARTSPVATVTGVKEDGEEEKMKRARGRPRLDTKDQTASEVGYVCLCLMIGLVLRIIRGYYERHVRMYSRTVISI